MNAANVVTLLLRGKQLYETHKEATAIMKLITEVEQAMKPKSLAWRILLEDSREDLPESRKKVLLNLIHLLSKTLTVVSVF